MEVQDQDWVISDQLMIEEEKAMAAGNSVSWDSSVATQQWPWPLLSTISEIQTTMGHTLYEMKM